MTENRKQTDPRRAAGAPSNQLARLRMSDAARISLTPTTVTTTVTQTSTTRVTETVFPLIPFPPPPPVTGTARSQAPQRVPEGGRAVRLTRQGQRAVFPLAAMPTPPALQNFVVRLGDVQAIFREASREDIDEIKDSEANHPLAAAAAGKKRKIDDRLLDASSPETPEQSLASSSEEVARAQQHVPSLADLPQLVSTFDALPTPLQSYTLLHLLRRCDAETLQYLSHIIAPTLRRDFLVELPRELTLAIVLHLDTRTLCRAAQVSRAWRALIGGCAEVWRAQMVRCGWLRELAKLEADPRTLLATVGSGNSSSNKSNSNNSTSNNSGPAVAGHALVGGTGALKKSSPPPESHSADSDDDDDDGEDEEEEEEEQSSAGALETANEDEEMWNDDEYEVDNDDDDDDEMERLGSAAASEDDLPAAVVAARATQSEHTVNDDEDGDGGFYSPVPFRAAKTKLEKEKQRRQQQQQRRHGSSRPHRGQQRPPHDGSSTGALLPAVDSHPYRVACEVLHRVGRNWREGACTRLSFAGHGDSVVTCLQFDDDKIVSGSDDQTINVYDIRRGVLRRTLVGHDGGVWCLQFHRNMLITGATDRVLRVWNVQTGACVSSGLGHSSTIRCLQLIPRPSPAAAGAGSSAGRLAHFWAVTGSRDYTLRVWVLPPVDAATGEPVMGALPHHHQQGTEDGELGEEVGAELRCRLVLTGHTGSVRALAAHGDVVVSGSYDSTLRMWNLRTGEALFTLRGHENKVYSVVYNGDRVASGSMDNTIRLWDPATGQCLHVLEGHSSLVGLLQMNADMLVSAAADTTIRSWNLRTGAMTRMMEGHSAAITCFEFHGNKVVSGSEDCLKLWDVETGKCVRDLVSDILGAWRVSLDYRRCVSAVQRANATWFEVLNFDLSDADKSVLAQRG